MKLSVWRRFIRTDTANLWLGFVAIRHEVVRELRKTLDEGLPRFARGQEKNAVTAREANSLAAAVAEELALLIGLYISLRRT